MNIILDVNIVVDICARRDPFYDDSLAAVVSSKTRGHRIWLYVGAVQTMGYTLGAELRRRHPAEAAPVSNSAHDRKAKELLQEFAQDKHWLAALAGEGDVFSSNDPEDEQLTEDIAARCLSLPMSRYLSEGDQ
jgi:UDP-2-acetamido-2-deoxy-ribo-hexuluronate aminotransferase